MYTIQYIAIIVILTLMIYAFFRHKKGKLELSDLITWEAFFIVLLIIALAPLRISIEIKRIFGLGRGLDALFVLTIGLTYILLFKLYLDIDKIEREITELNRKISIRLKELEDEIERKP
ncbi:DUF2304 domain-containing protein [Pyrococcus horikoshii]|uniref:UDP-N-acetylglucosamine--dolichyl-phosphate N-acetylglucosaminephosphotransferase n=2 Tax=Pyrococcus horikoshii TaxID=53953 RepID=O59262_PYRHO|nr:DUF2304 family protein [Pyrococcus horikoshii]BAA30698.1 118aa long hypothetical protein [Pyrococcus horikoshii OT3]HII60564.1 DUF2304 family protein [Pyrococcus horikoshii]